MSRTKKTASDEKLRQALPKGIAALFSKKELRKFFTGYLIMMGVLEGFIFFLFWISYLGGKTEGFPWSTFILAAFATPLLLTLLLTLVVIGFNRYLLGDTGGEPVPGENEPSSGRLEAFWSASRRIPFLAGLLLLILGAGLIYRLDEITAFITGTGEAAFRYLFISLGVVLAVAAVFGLLWMIFAYRLRKQSLDLLFRYKQEVTEKTGMVFLEDGTVIDRNGRLIEHRPTESGTSKPDNEKIAFLPKFPQS